MQVKDLVSGALQSVGPDATLQHASEKLSLSQQGLLPVCDGSQLLGVLTESDIVAACAEGFDPIRVRVRDAMTVDVLYCHADQELDEAAQLMKTGQVQRLLVMSRSGELVGVISLTDIAATADDVHLAQRALRSAAEPDAPPPLG